MTTQAQINNYLSGLPEQKRVEMLQLHELVLKIAPSSQLWFVDGKNAEGKIVSNPSIGYGVRTNYYTNEKQGDFYRVGISANNNGISVYIMGMADKSYLTDTYSGKIGKATITGYCIKFSRLSTIDLEILKAAIHDGFRSD